MIHLMYVEELQLDEPADDRCPASNDRRSLLLCSVYDPSYCSQDRGADVDKGAKVPQWIDEMGDAWENTGSFTFYIPICPWQETSEAFSIAGGPLTYGDLFTSDSKRALHQRTNEAELNTIYYINAATVALK